MDKGTKVIIGIVIVAAVVVGGYAAMMKPQPSTTESAKLPANAISGPIKLGLLAPLTGDAATMGEAQARGTQVAVDEINAAGGINGQMIELVTEDGKCDPQAAGTAAQKLVTIDEVKFIIGGLCSGETIAAAAITEPGKVIIISPGSSSPKITESGDFVFRTYPSDSIAGKIAAKYAYETLNLRKAALITELTDYSQGLREVYKTTFTQLGGEIVLDETYNSTDTDFRTQVLKAKTSGADVIYVVPQSATPGVAIFKQLKEAGVTATLTTAEVVLDRQVVRDNSEVLEGVIGVEVAIDYENNPIAISFRDAHRAKFDNTDPGLLAGNAYDAVMMLKEAISQVGLNTEAVRDYLYGVKNRPGVIGSISFDANGDPIMGESVVKVSGGKVENLASVAP